MTGYLLDVNVLVALFWPSHEHHASAAAWFSRHRARRWATCPVTETAFVRIVSNPAFSRDAVRPFDAIQVLTANTNAPDHVFWEADASVVEATEFVGARLVGHQQVTDAYLLGLAVRRGGVLATLDSGITSLVAADASGSTAVEVIR